MPRRSSDRALILCAIRPSPVNVLCWPGASGAYYRMATFPTAANFLAIPGVFVFSKMALSGFYRAAFVGHAENLGETLAYGPATFDRWRSFYATGATHISALHVGGGAAERVKIVADLSWGDCEPPSVRPAATPAALAFPPGIAPTPFSISETPLEGTTARAKIEALPPSRWG
jgi:hypothetical protein